MPLLETVILVLELLHTSGKYYSLFSVFLTPIDGHLRGITLMRGGKLRVNLLAVGTSGVQVCLQVPIHVRMSSFMVGLITCVCMSACTGIKSGLA